ncbi:MAG: Fic family protein [Gaiellaceae bacterium]
MNVAQFTKRAPGRLTTTLEGNPAFVPSPAPRQLRLSDDAIGLLDEASNRLGVLAGIARRLPNPELLVGPYLTREAVLSSRIEGTMTTLSDVYASEAQLRLEIAPDVQEVLNYLTAYRYGLGRLGTLPLSLRLLRELHGQLMEGVRGAEKRPGEFRTYQNFIGGGSEATARFVPPPPLEMKTCLDDLDKFMHDRSLRPLVQAAVLHYQFETIHPFGDGNGRVGRLLMGLFLNDRKLLPQPLLYLSAYFERTRDAYYDGLFRVSTHGEWDKWIQYVLRGVCTQANASIVLADRLQDLNARYRDRLHATHATLNALALVDYLFISPYITIGLVQERLGVTHPTARATIRTLEEHGILNERDPSRKWSKVFTADEVYALISGTDAEPEADNPS